MNEIESYLNLNITYMDYYVEYNEDLHQKDCGTETLYINVSKDIDIVLANLCQARTVIYFGKMLSFYIYISANQKLV